MNKININILGNKSLLAFHMAAKTLSFTRAADTLKIGQPAISHAIRQLENTLNTVLFKRQHHGVELTKEGEQLAFYLDKGFAFIQKGLETTLEKNNQQQVTLHISTSLASQWLMPRIAQFKLANPDIQLRCITQDTDNDVQQGDFDLCVPLGQVSWEGFQRQKFVDERITPVCSPDYIKRSPPLEHPSDLPQQTLIHLEERYTSRLDWHQLFTKFNLDYRNSTADESFNDYSIVLQAALEGQGVALGWKHLVKPLVDEGKLVIPVDMEIKTDQPFYILTPKDKVQNKAVSILREWLLMEINKQVIT
jgi:DNA-binding transcriptional LysR family regulator